MVEDDEIFIAQWGVNLVLTGLTASMVVNALVTGLIVFKILKVTVFLEVKETSVNQSLPVGSLSSTGGPKLRHIIFIIIEFGMALFAIQLTRVVLSSLVDVTVGPAPPSLDIAFNMVIIIIHQALNVIIRSVQFSTSFVLLMTFTWAMDFALVRLFHNLLTTVNNSFLLESCRNN